MITRLSVTATPGRNYAGFVAKVEAPIVDVRSGAGLSEEEFNRLEAHLLREQKRIRRQAMIRRDDDEILALLFWEDYD